MAIPQTGPGDGQTTDAGSSTPSQTVQGEGGNLSIRNDTNSTGDLSQRQQGGACSSGPWGTSCGGGGKRKRAVKDADVEAVTSSNQNISVEGVGNSSNSTDDLSKRQQGGAACSCGPYGCSCGGGGGKRKRDVAAANVNSNQDASIEKVMSSSNFTDDLSQRKQGGAACSTGPWGSSCGGGGGR